MIYMNTVLSQAGYRIAGRRGSHVCSSGNIEYLFLSGRPAGAADYPFLLHESPPAAASGVPVFPVPHVCEYGGASFESAAYVCEPRGVAVAYAVAGAHLFQRRFYGYLPPFLLFLRCPQRR